MGGTVTRPIRVLHVDDDRQRVEVTERVLETVNGDVEVVTETTVEDGLARLTQESVDCVVSDYEMPRMDGLEFLDAVRDEHPDLPFILFTGKGSEEIASEAISAGVTDYLQKGDGMDSYRILAKRIENAVAKREAESEAQQVYRALETASEGISLLDDDGRFTYVNRAYADLYGYDPEEMIGEHWELVYPDAEIDEVYEDILPTLDGNEVWRGETVGLRRDGSTFVEDHTLAGRDDGGLICTVQEVTDRGTIESASDDRPVLTTEVLDTSDVGTIVLGPDREIVWVNEAIEEYFGLERSEILGMDQRTVVHEKVKDLFPSPEAYADEVLEPVPETDDRRFECRVRETDRTEERWLEHWSQPIECGPYEGGRVKHYTDITERKRREEELARRRRELKHQNERLDEFASVLSHDLRNPLSIARTYTGLLRESGDADEEIVTEIERAHDRMQNIIDDVLTLAREGESIECTSTVRLSTIAERTWENVRTGDATLRIDGDRLVEADELRLRRLLENLLQNSVEHGGQAPTVRVGPLCAGEGSERTSDETGFYVEDDGPGVPEDEREQVFDSAYSTADGGIGFGLSIVRQIAGAHGWVVAVTESESGGARFEVQGVDVASE